MRVRVPLLALALSLVAAPALAEKAAVNFHLEPGVGTGLDRPMLVTGATLKIDTTLFRFLGPVAPQFEAFGLGAANHTYLLEGTAFGVGIGARLRLFNDEKGYRFNPGKARRTGNWWGNYWLDAHFTINTPGLGFDVATGAEFSVVEGLSFGPFARYSLMGPHSILTFGLTVVIGAPQTTPAEADFDGDGIKGDDDKCIDEPEDFDGFEDSDGCPEADNDKDGIDDEQDQCRDAAEDKDGVQDEDGCPETDADGDGVPDEQDKCPLVKGSAATGGCPDGDKDGDSVTDSADRCPEEKGPVENAGCPDTDKDGDTVVDRLDACPDEKGLADNKGCPYPDGDKDGVADRFDNCPSEPGPADNQGCPAKVKQLVVITREKIEIKDKIYFDTGLATIQARSFRLLEQIASVLKSHPEIKLVQIEGHTDSTGSAETNRKLSNDRANSVRDFLVSKGVEAARLRAVGFGPDRPVDTNETAEGREKNRRVEFNIVE
jgi:outer membrane protein OmpA-like peptidoglycan-associated protein